MPEHLAWHETLELHELVAFQSAGLTKLKMSIRKVPDHELRTLYMQAIQGIERNIRELLRFFPNAPGYDHNPRQADAGFYAGDLLGLAKASVRNYAMALTETATPELHQVLSRHLQNAVQLHYNVYRYMLEKGYYSSYDLHQLLTNDVKNAHKALDMHY
ncbi:spore coat protein [Fictibacillus sp. Mic-4]|uniref:spore coat protein n=1 Tax=Fictibacillus TaxID=1329200 RepID=UPI00041987B5|nr:spore coat protein [Fictibacillus gelatini]